MQASQRITQLALALITLVTLTVTGLAADPGTPFPVGAGPNDIRPGSVLVFNYYTSNAMDPSATDTTISITNTSATTPAFVHLFFVDGNTCSIADVTICLTENQTTRFRASDFDPGTTGYLIAVGSSPSNATPTCPSSRLIGSARLRMGAGLAVINALAIDGADTGTCAFASGSDFLLNIPIRVPRVLAADNVTSLADGTRTFIVINRIGGNLATGVSAIGPIFGLFYDDAENGFSFTFSPSGCQFRSFLTSTFPRTVPPITRLVPAGRAGWMKFFASNDRGITGVIMEFAADGSIGGRNMHALTLTSDTITVPVFGNNCF
jgi:hypothetical protein